MNKPVINSFDIFDTLIARKVLRPIEIFEIIEVEFPFPNFFNLRLQAEKNSNGTFESIYQNFQNLTNLDDNEIEKIKLFEIEIEIEKSIPIISNINRISKNDIYISDMYYSKEVIYSILNKNNIPISNELYVSPSGKNNGSMYQNLLEKYTINLHIGDNEHADIYMANKNGIKSQHTKIHQFTNFEKNIYKKGLKDFANILREMRLKNPYTEESLEYKLYEEQYVYNIPLLLFIALELNKILKNENRKTLLLLTRDSCLLYKIFLHCYPDVDCKLLHSSRLMNKNPNINYERYLSNMYNHEDSLIFDMCGSFNSGRNLFNKIFKKLPRVHILYLHTGQYFAERYEGLTNNFLFSTRTENSNNDFVGTMVNITDELEIIRAPTEISKKYIKIQHDAVLDFIKHISNSKFEINYYLSKIDTEDWIKLSGEFTNTVPVVVSNKDSIRLIDCAKKYLTDKGDSFQCSHNYIVYYELLINYFVNILNLESVKLLEIGLSRDGIDDIPSLKMWNEYFHENIEIYGFDINPLFLKYNNYKNNIHIYCGDQNKKEDLEILKKEKYTLIIDDGEHSSHSQQICLKELWGCVESQGCYVIENLHWQPYSEKCLKTKEMLYEWSIGNFIQTEYFNSYEINLFKITLDKIVLNNSNSNKYEKKYLNNAIAFLYKK
jgi:predicted HAD superfamily hydrolase